jgi:hypothetical protein
VVTPREHFGYERELAAWVLSDLTRLDVAGVGSISEAKPEVTAKSGGRVDLLASTQGGRSVVVELFLDACDRDHAARLLHYRAEHAADDAVIIAAAYSAREWQVLRNEHEALSPGGRSVQILELVVVDGAPCLRQARGPVDVDSLRRLAAIKANVTRGQAGRRSAAVKAQATRGADGRSAAARKANETRRLPKG